MGISAKQLELNTIHIDELADQIYYSTDCEVLKLILDEHLDGVRDLFDSIVAEQKEILEKYLPLSEVPFPSPDKIVKWIKKQITATVTPQLRAHIQYVKKLIRLARSVAKLIRAIQHAVETIPECVNELAEYAFEQLQNEIDTLIDEALATVKEAQDAIISTVRSEIEFAFKEIATHTKEAFEATADEGMKSIDAGVVELQKIDVTTGG